MAVKIIGLKDNLAEVLIPNQYLPSPITLTGTYQDITPNQILNVQGMINVAVWFELSASTNLVFQIKCFKDLTGPFAYADGYSVFSVKTSSGTSHFSEQGYNINTIAGGKLVLQIPVVDLVNNVKIFVKGSGQITSCSITPQTRGA